jgi:hypothetical protein
LNVHQQQQQPQGSHQVPKPTNEAQHHHHTPPGTGESSTLKDGQPRIPGKAPYGSGDAEDGYTLVFESMDVSKASNLIFVMFIHQLIRLSNDGANKKRKQRW